MADAPDSSHFENVAQAAINGRLTFFLGAGVNYAQQSDRTLRKSYDADSSFLPMAAELAHHLAVHFKVDFEFPSWMADTSGVSCNVSGCNQADNLRRLLTASYQSDLGKVSQQVQSRSLSRPQALTKHLYEIFSRTYEPTRLHHVLARCAKECQRNTRPIFITTNYDTMMEQALAAVNEPFDVIYYRAPGPKRPVWLYQWKQSDTFYCDRAKPEEKRCEQAIPAREQCEIAIIDIPNYPDLPLGKDELPRNALDLTDTTRARSLVVKLHGTVSPLGWERSFFVISPDDYIDFLRLVSLTSPFPSMLEKRLCESHFLFLGYGLGDWNILAICRNLWHSRDTENYTNYAVQKESSANDVRRWATPGSDAPVLLLDEDLTSYADKLAARLEVELKRPKSR